MELNEKNLLENLEKINSLDDWMEFEENFFSNNILIEKDNEEDSLCMNREDKTIDGITWHATSCGYKNTDIYFLHEKLSFMVFAKLEPEAAAENAAHPERYGQICCHCEIWTRSHQPKVCPICNGELLPFPLNEDDDD